MELSKPVDLSAAAPDVTKTTETHHPSSGEIDVEKKAIGALPTGDESQSSPMRLSASRSRKEQFDTASSCSARPTAVPRDKRRGLFGRFAVLEEVVEPKDYPRKTKWFITFIVAIAGAAAPLGSVIYLRSCFFFYLFFR